MQASLRQHVTARIQEIMSLDVSGIDLATRLSTISEWDSFNNLMLVSRLQDDLGVRFTATEIVAAETLGCVYDLVETKAGSKVP